MTGTTNVTRFLQQENARLKEENERLTEELNTLREYLLAVDALEQAAHSLSGERDLMSASLKLDWALGGGTLTSITAYDTIEELLTGDQFNFLPIPQSVLFQFFGSDQAQHQWLDVEAVSQERHRVEGPRGSRRPS